MTIPMARRQVLFDTCLWAQFFNRPQSREHEAISSLVKRNQACTIGPIIFEVLSGFKRKQHADWVSSVLQCIPEIEMGWNAWRSAANWNRELVSRGSRLPLADLFSATIALKNDLFIYSTDPHFRLSGASSSAGILHFSGSMK